MNYHLKVLSGFVEKDDAGRYGLTGKGLFAAQLLTGLLREKSNQYRLWFGDAVLIGLVGFILALINPGVWLPSFPVFLLGLIYASIVPCSIMWLLTVKRVKSHDLYVLLKPPLIVLSLFSFLFLFQLVLERWLNVELIRFPMIPLSRKTYIQLSIYSLLFMGVLPIIGSIILEAAYRILSGLSAGRPRLWVWR